jgi:hypothetical protein
VWNRGLIANVYTALICGANTSRRRCARSTVQQFRRKRSRRSRACVPGREHAAGHSGGLSKRLRGRRSRARTAGGARPEGRQRPTLASSSKRGSLELMYHQPRAAKRASSRRMQLMHSTLGRARRLHANSLIPALPRVACCVLRCRATCARLAPAHCWSSQAAYRHHERAMRPHALHLVRTARCAP